MIQAMTTIKPVRRLKQVCEELPQRAIHAAGLAGLYYTSSSANNGIWQVIGNLPKQQIERILAHAEAVLTDK